MYTMSKLTCLKKKKPSCLVQNDEKKKLTDSAAILNLSLYMDFNDVHRSYLSTVTGHLTLHVHHSHSYLLTVLSQVSTEEHLHVGVSPITGRGESHPSSPQAHVLGQWTTCMGGNTCGWCRPHCWHCLQSLVEQHRDQMALQCCRSCTTIWELRPTWRW